MSWVHTRSVPMTDYLFVVFLPPSLFSRCIRLPSSFPSPLPPFPALSLSPSFTVLSLHPSPFLLPFSPSPLPSSFLSPLPPFPALSLSLLLYSSLISSISPSSISSYPLHSSVTASCSPLPPFLPSSQAHWAACLRTPPYLPHTSNSYNRRSPLASLSSQAPPPSTSLGFESTCFQRKLTRPHQTKCTWQEIPQQHQIHSFHTK